MSNANTGEICSYGLIIMRPQHKPSVMDGPPGLTGWRECFNVGDGEERGGRAWGRREWVHPNPETDVPYIWEEINGSREYLLICRKDTLGFVEFVRGR